MDNFIQAYNKIWEMRLGVTIIIAIVVAGLIEAFPFLWGWILGFGIIGMIATLVILRYKCNQWRKEDGQTP